MPGVDGDPYRTPGARTASGAPSNCPRCGSKLERVGSRWLCPIGKCGEWLPPEVVGELLDMREPQSEFADVLRRSIARAEPWEPAPCPCCGEPMQTTLRARIVLDYCDGHGVWLDRGEREVLESALRLFGLER